MLLQFLNPALQVPVLLFQSLDVAPRSCATSNSIGRPALCVILQAWRASAGEAITSDLAHLWWDISVWARDLRGISWGSQGAYPNLAAIARLASPRRGQQLLLDRI